MALVLKNLPANAGDVRRVGSVPGLGRSPGEGYGNPLQCSCLENPRDWGAWWAAIDGVAQSRTRLKRLSSSSSSTLMNGLPWWLSPKESACNAGDMGSIPGSGRFPGGKYGNPLQCSCLENPMDRGALGATVHRVTQSQTQPKRLSTHC